MDYNIVHDYIVIHHRVFLSQNEVVALCNVINGMYHNDSKKKAICKHEWSNTGLRKSNKTLMKCSFCGKKKFTITKWCTPPPGNKNLLMYPSPHNPSTDL